MIDELMSINAVAAARDVTNAMKMACQSGKMDIDVHATYLNIFRGYSIQNVLRVGNKVFIYFDISEQPIVLASNDDQQNTSRHL
jgi:hypothetical protein